MIVLALTMVLQTATPTPVPDDEIVVIGRKLRSMRFQYTTRKWKLHSCRVTSAGADPVLAQAACEAIGWCADQRRADKKQISACIDERRPEMLDRVAALRAGPR